MIEYNKNMEENFIECASMLIQESIDTTFQDQTYIRSYLSKWRRSKKILLNKFKFDPNKLTIEIPVQGMKEPDIFDTQNQLKRFALSREASYIKPYVDSVKEFSKDSKEIHRATMLSRIYEIFYRGIIEKTGLISRIAKNEGLAPDESSCSIKMYSWLRSVMCNLVYFQGVEIMKEGVEQLSNFQQIRARDELVDQILNQIKITPKLTKQMSKASKFFPSESIKFVIDQMITTISFLIALEPKKLTENSTFVLSIHPMDYLTMSLNDCNWSSCASPEGEHFESAWSTMIDTVTMVAYLKSDKSDVKIGDNFWNNKKLRFLVHWDQERPEFIVCNKIYPMKCLDLYDHLIKHINQSIGTDFVLEDRTLGLQYFHPEPEGNSLEDYGFYWDNYNEGVFISKEYYTKAIPLLEQYIRVREAYHYPLKMSEIADELGYDYDEIMSVINDTTVEIQIGNELHCLGCGEITGNKINCDYCAGRYSNTCYGGCSDCENFDCDRNQNA